MCSSFAATVKERKTEREQLWLRPKHRPTDRAHTCHRHYRRHTLTWCVRGNTHHHRHHSLISHTLCSFCCCDSNRDIFNVVIFCLQPFIFLLTVDQTAHRLWTLTEFFCWLDVFSWLYKTTKATDQLSLITIEITVFVVVHFELFLRLLLHLLLFFWVLGKLKRKSHN